eukprot:CAMPEP_0115405186 /NCGR_PEP_ID=MMETSP0271-20121206/17801_1 /TAXON_ID=71861 /ORGANISM="Scrippsiella trochoidea, Strain CCMP3099" /LENGTH=45 /DNA_ID= /DNA_START= /DNA_END= /DNA_ORIENTATION=
MPPRTAEGTTLRERRRPMHARLTRNDMADLTGLESGKLRQPNVPD